MKSLVRLIWSRLQSLVRKSRLDREFDDELAMHLAELTDEARRRGLSESDARREALLKLGHPALLREQHRDARGLPMVDALVQDSRYAVRTLWKSPAFTTVVTLTLALGIGANTALFSLVDNLLLRSLPVRDADRLFQLSVSPATPGLKKPFMSFDSPVFDLVRAQRGVVSEAIGFMRLDRPSIAIGGVTELTREVEQVSDNYFRDLGVTPIVGRAPQASDDNVALISDRWWRTRFDADTNVLSRTLTVNGKTYAIIGVAPPGFGGFVVEHAADLWLAEPSSGFSNLMMIVRVQPGVSIAQAQTAIHPIARQSLLDRLKGNMPPDQAIETELLPAGQGLSQLRSQYRGALLALMALVTLVLLTTCTNVGNLLMLRNAARRRELTVRAALGAGRSRLVSQYLVESTILAAAGCIAGLFLARWGVSVILSMLPLPALPDGLAFQWDVRIVGFAAGVAIASALLFGLAPAWRATDVDLTGALRASQGSTTPKRTRRLGRVLVGCQVAFSVLLLVGAGLFVQTLRNLSTLNIGYNTDRLLQVSIDTRFAGYKPNEVGPVYRLLLERLSALPGVRSASGIRNGLMGSGLSRMAGDIPGLPVRPDESWDSAEVGPSFFETLGITAVRGRTFVAADFAGEGSHVVVNEAFAKHFFGDQDPTVIAPTIVGVVPDVKLFGVRREVGPMMYEAMRREPDRINALEVRIVGDPAAISPAIRQTIQAVNPRLFVGIRTLQEAVERDIARERMVAAISTFFSLLGLALASIGIFGVASSTVAHRTKELGIRRALGAGRWSVIRESLRETLVVFALGLTAGTIGAVVAVRLSASVIADLLFGLTATDAVNLVGAVAVMAAVAIVACLLPAHRATRIDPLASIREE